MFRIFVCHYVSSLLPYTFCTNGIKHQGVKYSIGAAENTIAFGTFNLNGAFLSSLSGKGMDYQEWKECVL